MILKVLARVFLIVIPVLCGLVSLPFVFQPQATGESNAVIGWLGVVVAVSVVIGIVLHGFERKREQAVKGRRVA